MCRLAASAGSTNWWREPVPDATQLVTRSVTFTCACGPPVLFPVTITLVFPVLVVALTVSVNVEVAGLPGVTLTEAGLKLAVAPPGKPLAVRLTAPAKPPDEVTVILVAPLGF